MLDLIADWYTTNKPDDWRSIVGKAADDLRKKNANQ